MTTREIEVPKIPESVTYIVYPLIKETDKHSWFLISKFETNIRCIFGENSDEYKYFFNSENANEITFSLFALKEYEVIKEPRYVIKFPFEDVCSGIHDNNYLNLNNVGGAFWRTSANYKYATRFTMKEIKTNHNLKGLEQYAVEVKNDN